MENHGAQLAAYRLAVLGAGAARVDAELVFLRGGIALRPLPLLDAAAEEGELVRAGEALGAAVAAGGAEAFPRGPEAPARCTALGCGHVRRCWGAAAPPHS